MLDQVTQDIKEAMKAKEKERLQALRYLKSMLIENKTSPKPKEELEVAIQYSKKLRNSLEEFPEGSEQRDKITKEIEFLTPYLPSPMEETDVRNLIRDIISKLDSPNMGAVMKDLSPQIKGKFDGKKASSMVKEELG